MKIPTSSSILLATLAISSSSTSLAAPAPVGESGLVSSQSTKDARDAYHGDEGGADGSMLARSEDNNLEARGNGMVSDILAGLPIVGPIAKALLVKDCPPPGTASAESVSEEDLANLQNAVDTVNGALSGILPISPPVPVPSDALGGLVSMIPAPAPMKSAIAGLSDDGGEPDSSNQPSEAASSDVVGPTPTGDVGAAQATEPSGTGSSFLISPTTTIAAEGADETQSPSESTFLSSSDAANVAEATPTSPGVPAGPPNTPAMPETTSDPNDDSDDVDPSEEDPEAK
ncbi:hypothetical protein CC2G_000460 [Coprinopsis cinerea AmutBmut pab1-1]|nr:hypothetical protein CC2G_000460 [Coprinopsis cinerea AmutBmut pab1-1]